MKGSVYAPSATLYGLVLAFRTYSYHGGRKRADFNLNSNRNRDLILGTLRNPRDHDGVPAVTRFAEDRSDPVEGSGGKAGGPN